MKKFTKICLITALALFLAGAGLCAAGAAAGGFRMLNDRWYEEGHGSHTNLWARLADSMNYGMRHDWEEGWYDDWKEEWGDMGSEIREEVQGIGDEVRDGIQEMTDEVRNWNHDYDYDYDYDYDHDYDYDYDYDHDYDYDYNYDHDEWEDGWDHDHDSDWGNYDSAENRATISVKGYTDMGIGSAAITDLRVDIGGAECYVLPSEGDSFGIEKKEGEGSYRYYVIGKTLYVEGIRRHITEKGRIRLYLYIPKGMSFNSASLAVGGGMASLGEFSADRLDVTVGGGMMKADRIAGKEITATVGAGEIRLDQVEARELEINIGAGKAVVNGNITEEIEVECGMGKTLLVLAGSEKDYNYKLKSSAGSITVGDRSYTAVAGEKYIDNGARAECKLESAMGNIQIDFEK